MHSLSSDSSLRGSLIRLALATLLRCQPAISLFIRISMLGIHPCFTTSSVGPVVKLNKVNTHRATVRIDSNTNRRHL